jgi:hypothetical protein
MNRRSHRRLLLSVLGSAALLAGISILLQPAPWPAFAAPLAPGAPVAWFASSSGWGEGCAQAEPCSLATAVAKAATGDVIYVRHGTYTGEGPSVITLTASITLYGGWNGGATGPVVRDPHTYVTTLDGESERRVVFISGAISPTIEGFVITGGNAANAVTGPGKGGGIYGLGASPVISDNTIRYNVAHTSTTVTGRGGGIYLENIFGRATIRANQVFSNIASTSYSGYGGGIGLGYAGEPLALVVDNVIISNTGSITGNRGYGGGIYVFGTSGATIEDNSIEHNRAKLDAPSILGAGGGIYCESADDLVIQNNTLRYNTAAQISNGSGGAIRTRYCDSLSVTGNIIEHNVGTDGSPGTGRGGGLNATGCEDVDIYGNWFYSNTADISYYSGIGGALYLGRDTSFTMTNNIVAANWANSEGGGLAFEAQVGDEVTGTLVYNTFASNDRGWYDAGCTAIHLNDAYVTLVLTNNIIYGHSIGIYATDGSTATLDHTLFFANTTANTSGPGAIASANAITDKDPYLDYRYHIGEGSGAFNAAVDIPWVTEDYDGDPRPLRNGFDIGADERGYGVWLPLVLRSY